MNDYYTLADLANCGGFTFDLATGTFPDKGYAVSTLKDVERVYPGGVTAEDVEAFVAKLPDTPGILLGAWRVEGDVYLDASIVVNDVDEAMELARKHDQIAIYDLALGLTYYTQESKA